jgi:hypothetical protein
MLKPQTGAADKASTTKILSSRSIVALLPTATQGHVDSHGDVGRFGRQSEE